MADVEMVIDALRQSSVNGQWVVILREKTAEQYLPVYIGSAQADTIKRELIDVSTPRPLDDDIVYRGIAITCSEVKAARLYRFKDNRFFAKLILDASEVDCSPATALAIAIRLGVPILTDELVLNKAGISVTA